MLHKNENGRWEIERLTGSRGQDKTFVELSCGSVIEVRLDGQWIKGRVEHSKGAGGYFLLIDEHAVLILSERLTARLPGAPWLRPLPA